METKISGVYKITNTITGDFYIGSSLDIKKRWRSHRSSATWAYNTGMKLYQVFMKYGLNNFAFEIIEKTDNLHEREQYWIDKLQPTYNSKRANGWDIEKYKEYQQSEKYKDTRRKYMKKYRSQLCLYEGETLTLNALKIRFYRQGIPHPTLEAKKYLLGE